MSFLNPRYLRNTFSIHSEGLEPRVIPHNLSPQSRRAIPLIAAVTVDKHIQYTRDFLLAFSGTATVLLLFNYQGAEGQIIGPGRLPELLSSEKCHTGGLQFGTKIQLEIWGVQYIVRLTSKRIGQQGRHAEKKIQGGITSICWLILE